MTTMLDKVKTFCAGPLQGGLDAFIARCSTLLEFLEKENQSYNLTRIVAADDYWNKHVADSFGALLAFPELAQGKLKLLDIGCGAGFPSLVLAAACPNLAVTAMDSTGKKVRFVAMAAELLSLTNLEAVQGRGREFEIKPEWQGGFDFVTARAVGDAPTLCREAGGFLERGGRLVIYHSSNGIDADLLAASKDAEGKRFQWKTSEPFELPGGERRQFLYGVKR